MNDRRKAYERKQKELLAKCAQCIAYNSPTPECCDNCSTGKRLRWLESEYSDVTGWKHSKMWKKEV